MRALTRINLGGTAIGSGSGAPASYRRAIVRRLNEIAGQKFTLRPNLYDAAQNIDDLAAVSAELAMLAEVLIKIAQDLRLLASGPEGGFGEIILPAVQEGSSIFPGKINPGDSRDDDPMLLPGAGMRARDAACAGTRRAELERLRGRGGREHLRCDRDDASDRSRCLSSDASAESSRIENDAANSASRARY